jgi:hypothetical protein
MRIEGNIVVLERKDCHWCDENGTSPTKKWKVCEKCKGTGKRGNGRCRNCNDRDGYYPDGRRPGFVQYFDHEDRQPCTRCKGNKHNFDEENWTDNIDVSFLPVEVLRTGRVQGWYESHIGQGVYTVVDYGANQKMTDEQIIAPVVKELAKTQACKVVNNKEEMRLCEKIIIITGRTGYSAMPYWEDGR